MSKTLRILQLINLLVSRDCVTLENIRTTCDIPTRTAYRYLNWISEANIPVYYDKNAEGYRLSRSPRSGLHDISAHDLVLMVICLKAMSGHVNEGYREDLDRVITKILVRQRFQIDDTFVQNLDLGATPGRSPDYSEMLMATLVTVAVAMGRPVRLTVKGEDGKTHDEEIINPRLKFSREWQVEADRPEEPSDNRFSSLAKVTVL